MAAPLVLGVDAGNSKTVALVAGPDGAVLGAGRGGPGDIYGSHGEAAAFAEIERAVEGALRDAGVDASQIYAAGFSMAGADWPEDFVLLETAMAERGYGRNRTIVNDAIGALWAAIPEGVGIVITCGTGAAIGARAADGRLWHSSFWPDEAGGYRLGERAIRAAISADLGLAPPTRLTEPLLAALAVDSVEAMLHRRTVRQPAWTIADAARLAPIVLDAARDGDPAAVAIVAEQGRALGDMGVVAARKTGLAGRFPAALAGG
ncbi:MAG TPA: BadF/BadG/BcrA/BcrD ATPase family protein, partial [Thermomicrobiales bacterium]|nr:BadF/BadG/BcrA/BcrD ATPase family protein [Thermomicrobiales bacterium]